MKTADRSPRAIEVAKQGDVIVLAIGGNEQTSREAWNLKHMGDRTSLDLIGRQQELVDAMVATGKAGRRRAVQRTSALDRDAQRAGPGNSRMLVLGSGMRRRGGRHCVWRSYAGRKTADQHSAIVGTSAGVL
jgi:hypothetical protein